MIDTATAKAHLVVEHSDHDVLIAALIKAAEDYVEQFTGRAVNERATETLILDGFSSEIELPVVPVQSIVSIKYQDGDNVQQTLDAVAYVLDTRKLKAIVRPVYDTTWPDTYAAKQSVTITYKVGYVVDAEPASLRAAALLIIGSLYEQREDHVTGTIISRVPLSAEALMQAYVVPVVG